MTQHDNQLIKEIINGEQKAFKILYQRYSDLLFAYILHKLNNDREMATEIWQETWVVFVEKVKDFQFKSSIFTWMCAIAKNKISDYYRRTNKQRLFQSNVNHNFDIDSEELDNELIDPEIQANVIAVLASLTTEHKYLLEEKYIGNKRIDEISNEIGKSYKATESMLVRARESFRKEFKRITKD